MRHSPTHQNIQDNLRVRIRRLSQAYRPTHRGSDRPSRARSAFRAAFDRARAATHAATHPTVTRIRNTRTGAAVAGYAQRARHAMLLSWVPSGRMAIVMGSLCCLGLVTFTQGPIHAARATQRAAALAAGVDDPTRPEAQRGSRGGARTSTPSTKVAKAPAKPAGPPAPVAGLTRTQMNNAYQIVRAGQAMKMPKRALVIAVATAMQESDLRNLASYVVPESLHYPHEGTGADHDSVGLFQQRASGAWGPVKGLMTPGYSATQFYRALRQVPGWQQMSLTWAAQSVQISAYPYAYARHEGRAQQVVTAITR